MRNCTWVLGGIISFGTFSVIPRSVAGDMVPVHSGTVSTLAGDGVYATGSWDGQHDNGFQIEYTVLRDTENNYFTYTYDISGVGGVNLSKSLSNFTVQVSDSFGFDNIKEGTTTGGELRSRDATGTYHYSTPAESKYDFSWGPISGIKWNTTGEVLRATYVIVSDRVPMAGQLFAKDGQGTSAMSELAADVYVPDTHTYRPPPVVPLPAAAWGGLALFGVLGTRQVMQSRRGA